MKLTSILFFTFLPGFALAQRATSFAPASYSGSYTRTDYGPAKPAVKPRRHRNMNWEERAQLEFYKRMEAAVARKKKEMKLMSKPQFSDFSYFGHKRKPKKRPPSKMRYCKECGIRH